MPSPATRLATYADLLDLPEDVHAEIVGGELVVSPSPTPVHQGVMALIGSELVGPFQRGRGGPGGWWLIPDVDVSFGRHDILRPDLSGWRKERVPGFPEERPIEARPDWVCEALSPSTASMDQGRKRAIYQQGGVPWYWIIDTHHRTVSVYRLAEAGFVLEQSAGDESVARLPPFDAIEIDVAALFPLARSR